MIVPEFIPPASLQTPSKRTKKWIVVTSIQAPTEDVKRLASYPEWTLVVVGDSKTPANWSLPDVHYLSLDAQEALGFQSVKLLPTKSYTRKNAGYLYAIANGAQWIYDTDDDNKPFGKGLDQFEYSSGGTRGLRFTATENAPVQERLFNPYRHFGRAEMWPRGFPLEHIKKHNHDDGSYRLCRVQRPSAVQQGIVHKDPDVDAVYRLLHAEPTTGLDESFNQFAPPITHAPGTYAPWNSQNTLFSRAAFFGLFLPTTVAFRVTDIWRSYFTQTLLHAAGETVAFVPVNAIQNRNAHNYLVDFGEELDVYAKAGDIVRFIDGWRCTIELARQFAQLGFWGDADAQLVQHWVKDLQKIGYRFPNLRANARDEYPLGDERDVRRNCRRAHVSFANDLPANKSEPAEERAAVRIAAFSDLKHWCGECGSNKSESWLFPAQEDLATAIVKNTTLIDNYQSVAIVSNNWPWTIGMGLLQRMHEANFAMLIFCGHISKEDRDEMHASYNAYSKLKRLINYIDMSEEEVHEGFLMYYCLAKVEEMKIQNVKGYFMFSDDMIFNFWNPLNLNIVQGVKRGPGGWGPWWADRKHGFNAMKRTIHLIEGKYKNDPEVQRFAVELNRSIDENPRIDSKPYEYLMEANKLLAKPIPIQGDGWANGDWMYIPSSNISFVAMFAQLAHEGGLFHELFTSKLLNILPSEGEADYSRVVSLWGGNRTTWSRHYSETLYGVHPVKLSEFQDKSARSTFCDVSTSNNSFASQLAQSLSSSSDSNASSSSFTASGSSSDNGSFSSFSNAAPTPTGMTAVSNPFFIGNLAPTDQDRLRSAFGRF
ncbi:hypothetical protein PRIPAC_80078 [Pristionchus pacificus]|nr:hypothetical protein PRIPAC_80078 [Pristionchus pacificus]